MGDRRSIGSKGLPLALLLLGAAVIALALLATVIATTPYVGSDRCATEGCHDEIYSSWESTGHGLDFSWFDSHGTMLNLYTNSGGNTTTGMTGSCAVCHVVGYNDVANGGFDKTKPWNDTYNLPLLRIGCEACHGAATGHPKDDKLPFTEFTYAESCSANGDSGCHSGNRQYGNETIPGWEESAHANELPVERQGTLSCANCRATEGFIAMVEGSPLTSIPEDGLIWKITCAACHDPHPDEGGEHEGQLRVSAEEICEECHHSTSSWPGTNPHHPQTEMRTGTMGQDVTSETWMAEVSCPECHMYTTARGVTPAKQSHDWTPDPESCMVCHSEWETAEECEEYIEEMMAKTEAKLAALEPYITDLGKLKSWAQKNESTPKALWTDAINTSYNKALWNYNLVVNDKSMGMHNPQFTWELLDASMENAGAVKDALNIGGISGKVEYSGTPAEPIANATIKDGNGNQVAKTGADGSFFFWGPARNRLYVVELDGKPIGTFMADGQAQMNKTIATTTIEKAVIPEPPEPEEEDESLLNSLSYGLIAVIVILIILLVVMAMRKK